MFFEFGLRRRISVVIKLIAGGPWLLNFYGVLDTTATYLVFVEGYLLST